MDFLQFVDFQLCIFIFLGMAKGRENGRQKGKEKEREKGREKGREEGREKIREISQSAPSDPDEGIHPFLAIHGAGS